MIQPNLLTFAFAVLSATLALASTPEVKPADKARVLLEEIQISSDTKRIIVPVKVEAKIQSTVGADIEGHVTRILKPLGSSVKVGEIILFLENKDPGFTYAAVPVRSPVSGIVSQFYTTQMAKVSRGDKLFTVINPKSLKLAAEFPSGDISFVKSGAEGVFKMDGQKDGSSSVRILGISPLVDARTGTASAELEFINTKNALPPIGSVGQALFEIYQGSIIMIPEASLVYQEGKPMVRVLKGQNQFDKKLIELGEQRDSSFIVKSGITKGDKIVVRASRPLKEGDVFDIEPAPAKTQ